MKLRTAFALAIAAFTVAVPVATATPDGYQPQLKSTSQPDAFERYLRNNAPVQQPDAFTRYLRNNAPQSGAVTHPDSRGTRFSLAVAATPTPAPSGEGRDWSTGVIGALIGAFSAVLAIVGASSIRERRRLILR